MDACTYHLGPGFGGARVAGSSPAALGMVSCKGASPLLDQCWPQALYGRVCMGLHQSCLSSAVSHPHP